MNTLTLYFHGWDLLSILQVLTFKDLNPLCGKNVFANRKRSYLPEKNRLQLFFRHFCFRVIFFPLFQITSESERERFVHRAEAQNNMLRITSKPFVLKFWYNLARFGNENYQSCGPMLVCMKLKSAAHKREVDCRTPRIFTFSATASSSSSNDRLEIIIFLPWKNVA